MHIPDNCLSPSTCAVFGVVMVPIWKTASAKVKEEISRKKLPLIGICSAFSFLIMMFNVPVPGGTTAHAVGASLIAILLGPWAAVIALTITLAIQALLFGDGGILAFGANSFNMAFVIPITSYFIYRFIKGKNENRGFIAAFIAGYISINIAAICAALEFGIQPLLFKDASGRPLYFPYSLKDALFAMSIAHLTVVGFIEGFVSAGVLAYLKKVSPGIIYENKPIKMRPIKAILLVLVILCPLGLIASGTAWGEWGNEEIKNIAGYVPKGMEKGFSFNALLSNYSLHGVTQIVGYLLSAVIGVTVLLLIFKLMKHIGENKA